MAQTIKVRDAMRAKVMTLSPDDSITSALTLFEDARISGAPVVDLNGKLLGVLTLADVARPEHVSEGRLSSQRGGFEMGEVAGDERTDESDPEEVFYAKEDYSAELLGGERVSDWMTREVISVSPDSTLTSACRVMTNQSIHRIFVSEHGRLVGVLSSFDVVRAVAGDRTAK